MKKKLVSVLLIVLLFAGCRTIGTEIESTTDLTAVTADPTTIGNESSISLTEPTLPAEPAVSPTQADTVPGDVSAIEPKQDSASAEASPPEVTPTQTTPAPTESAIKTTSPSDTRPAETDPPETYPPETQPTETKPTEAEPTQTEPPTTTPPDTESTLPTGCSHNWICIHHDEEGHWIAGVICDCSWKVYGDPEEVISLWNDHSASYPAAEALFDHGGYGCVDEWIVDVPAYEEWVCRYCAEPKP